MQVKSGILGEGAVVTLTNEKTSLAFWYGGACSGEWFS